MITNKQIINDIKRVKELLNKIPTYKEYKINGKYSISTISRRFGKWTTIIISLFGKSDRTPPKKKTIINCLNCNSLTKNAKFCSSKCYADYENVGKRLPHVQETKFFCETCKTEISYKRKQCVNCFKLKNLNNYGEKELGFFNKSTYARHRYQNIRHHAHRVIKFYNLKTNCKICGYSNTTQLCHIKPISSFSKSTKLKEINSLSNLIFLCPNHHWELDHGILKI